LIGGSANDLTKPIVLYKLRILCIYTVQEWQAADVMGSLFCHCLVTYKSALHKTDASFKSLNMTLHRQNQSVEIKIDQILLSDIKIGHFLAKPAILSQN